MPSLTHTFRRLPAAALTLLALAALAGCGSSHSSSSSKVASQSTPTSTNATSTSTNAKASGHQSKTTKVTGSPGNSKTTSSSHPTSGSTTSKPSAKPKPVYVNPPKNTETGYHVSPTLPVCAHHEKECVSANPRAPVKGSSDLATNLVRLMKASYPMLKDVSLTCPSGRDYPVYCKLTASSVSGGKSTRVAGQVVATGVDTHTSTYTYRVNYAPVK